MFVITHCFCVSFWGNRYWADSTSCHTCCEINAHRTRRSHSKFSSTRTVLTNDEPAQLPRGGTVHCARPRLPLAASHRLDSRQHKVKSHMQADNPPPLHPPEKKKPMQTETLAESSSAPGARVWSESRGGVYVTVARRSASFALQVLLSNRSRAASWGGSELAARRL